MNPNHDHRPAWAAALKIAAIYAIIGALWILCSGWLLRHFVHDASLAATLEYVKGWFYVLATAVLVGWWLDRHFRKIRSATELLRKSETRFTSIFNHHLEAVGISRLRDGVFMDVNEAFARLHGYTREEIIGRTSEQLQLWHSTSRLQVIEELREKKSLLFEMQARCKDGQIRDLLASLQLIELDGEPCLLGTLIDLTERKLAEVALRESEERFRALFEQAAVGVAEIESATGRFLRVNQQYCDMVGYTREEMLRLDFQTLTHPDDLAADLAQMEQLKAGKTREFTMEKRYYRKDGALVWVALTVSPLWPQGSAPTRHVAVVQNITERKRTEEALYNITERERFFADIVEKSTQPLGIGYPDGRLGICNRAFCELTGYSAEELLAISWTTMMTPPKWIQSETQALAELERTGVPVRYQKEYIRKDGACVPVELLVHIVKDESGQPLHYYAFVTDITARNQAEKALREAETRYSELFENINVGVAVYEAIDDGRDFVFKDFNRAGEQIDHDDRRRLISRSVRQVRPGIEQFGLLDVFRRVWQTGKPEHHPVTQYQDTVMAGWYENYVYRLPSGEIVAVFDNVTERKQAEEKLRESEEKYRFLLDNTSDFIARYNRNGMMLFASGASSRFNGYLPEEIVNTNAFERIHPEDHDKVRSAMNQLIEEGIESKLEMRIMRKTGEYLWVEITGRRVFSPEGEPEIIAAQRNISERKQAEENLRVAKSFLDSVIDSSPFAMWFADKEGTITRVNRSLCDAINLNQDQIIGKYNIFQDATWSFKASCLKFGLSLIEADLRALTFRGKRPVPAEASFRAHATCTLTSPCFR